MRCGLGLAGSVWPGLLCPAPALGGLQPPGERQNQVPARSKRAAGGSEGLCFVRAVSRERPRSLLGGGGRPRPSHGASPLYRLVGAFPPPVSAAGFIHCRCEVALGGGPLGPGTCSRALWGLFGRGSPGVPDLQATADPRPGGSYPRGARTQTKGSPQVSGGVFQLLKLWVLFFFTFFFKSACGFSGEM